MCEDMAETIKEDHTKPKEHEEASQKKEKITELKKRIEELENQLKIKSEEYNRLLDISKRIKAEYENYKKRTEIQFYENLDKAKAEILVDIIHIFDDIERAVENLKPTSPMEEWQKGIELIVNKFKKFFELQGLKVINPLNEAFNPEIHEALVSETSSVDKEIISEVFQKGYMLNKHLLRPAKVKVSKPEKIENIIESNNKNTIKETEDKDHE